MTQETTVNVKVETVQGPFEGKYGDFHKVVWETDQGRFSKILKEGEEAPGLEGKQVCILHTGGKYQNVIKYSQLGDSEESLTIPKKEIVAKAVKTNENGPKSSQKAEEVLKNTVQAVNNTYKDNSAGQRNGMITGRAVELAIARGETDLEGMQQAALDVKALADFVENQS